MKDSDKLRTVVYNNGYQTWEGKSNGEILNNCLKVFPAYSIQLGFPSEYKDDVDHINVPIHNVYSF